eukprot:scaffold56267_cov19-Tisochrysis_lutea.AAC.1
MTWNGIFGCSHNPQHGSWEGGPTSECQPLQAVDQPVDWQCKSRNRNGLEDFFNPKAQPDRVATLPCKTDLTAVRTAVTMQQPDAVVYEVNHCAYALLRKGSASAAAPQPPSQQQFERSSYPANSNSRSSKTPPVGYHANAVPRGLNGMLKVDLCFQPPCGYKANAKDYEELPAASGRFSWVDGDMARQQGKPQNPHAHARAHARTRTHTCTHTRARTRTHSRTHAQNLQDVSLKPSQLRSQQGKPAPPPSHTHTHTHTPAHLFATFTKPLSARQTSNPPVHPDVVCSQDPSPQHQDAVPLLQGQQGPGLSAPLTTSKQQQQQQVVAEGGSVVISVDDVPCSGEAKGADASATVGPSKGVPSTDWYAYIGAGGGEPRHVEPMYLLCFTDAGCSR